MNKCELVRSTCLSVQQEAKHVQINQSKLNQLAQQYQAPKTFNQDHFHQTPTHPELQLLQLFILDFSNFCFWPLDDFEYQQLATNIQQTVQEGITLQQLAIITPELVKHQIFHGVEVPQLTERARIFRELGTVTLNKFEGSLVKLVKQANNSVITLLNILTQNYPNLQDHSIYRGRQVHFYKRAQILIGDIYGSFNGQGLGYFQDIQQLTMYPDYRVPQVLMDEGVFEYSGMLRQMIEGREQIKDRQLQVQIRACSVIAVEWMRCLVEANRKVKSIQIDWFLWQRGQANLKKLPPHHRCLTIYY